MNPKTAIHEALQSMIDAAANAAGLPLTTWLVQAAREKLACENGKMGLTMYGELYQIDR